MFHIKIAIGILLIARGFINAMQSGGSFKPTGGIPNPGWLGWWPVPMGQSWLLARLGIERSFAGTLAGILWRSGPPPRCLAGEVDFTHNDFPAKFSESLFFTL